MKCEWKEVTVADLGIIVTGKTPLTKNQGFWNGQIPFITPKDIQGTKHILQTERKITNFGLESVKGAILPPMSICVSCIGNIGYTGMTTKYSVSNQQINSIIVNEENDAEFVYYLMRYMWPSFKNYEGQSTALSILNKSQFSKIAVLIPNKSTQEKISAILSVIDDKIELNNAINNNLEQQAQALFKSWFVDFEPFGGIKPNDWEKHRLGEVCNCELGGTPSRSKPEYWNGTIPWINSGEVNQFRIIAPSEYITQLGLEKSATKLLPAKTTVLAITGATLGQVSLLEIASCANQSVVGVVPNPLLPYEYVYPLIKSNISE